MRGRRAAARHQAQGVRRQRGRCQTQAQRVRHHTVSYIYYLFTHFHTDLKAKLTNSIKYFVLEICVKS